MKTLALLLLMVPMVAAAATPVCDVWAREVAFAKSVADQDTDAFRELVHPDAVFFAPGPVRGRDAVAGSWAGIIADGALNWHPREVVVAGDGVALSRGPYWFRDTNPEAAASYAMGQYLSIWQKDADGAWRVLFDGAGASPPKPTSEAEISAMVAALPDCAG